MHFSGIRIPALPIRILETEAHRWLLRRFVSITLQSTATNLLLTVEEPSHNKISLIFTMVLDLFLLQVVTAQYFVWFFCLLPLILPWSNMKLKWEGLSCILVWIGAQLHWLMWGYLLEFKGKNVFLQLWLAGLLFLAANTFVLIMITCRHTYSPVFQRLEHPTLKNAEKNN